MVEAAEGDVEVAVGIGLVEPAEAIPTAQPVIFSPNSTRTLLDVSDV